MHINVYETHSMKLLLSKIYLELWKSDALGKKTNLKERIYYFRFFINNILLKLFVADVNGKK